MEIGGVYVSSGVTLSILMLTAFLLLVNKLYCSEVKFSALKDSYLSDDTAARLNRVGCAQAV